EALFVCAQRPATTRSGLPFDAHLSRSERQQLLSAGAVGDLDGTDGAAGVFGVEQGFGLAPDACAVPVELHGGDPVDRFAAAFLAD
ncbi:hypothetical protein ACWEKM_46440, partial [Streptomyces sp. NPDC004752]